jgi:hypothetical protein
VAETNNSRPGADTNQSNDTSAVDNVEAASSATPLPAWAIAIIAVAICLLIALVLGVAFLLNRKKSRNQRERSAAAIVPPACSDIYGAVAVPPVRTSIYDRATIETEYSTVPPTATHNYGPAPRDTRNRRRATGARRVRRRGCATITNIRMSNVK